VIANRGTDDVTVRHVTLHGFDGDATCTLTAVTGRGFGGFGGGRGRGSAAASNGPPISVIRKDQVAQCDPAVTIPSDAIISEPYWHRDGEAGRYRFDEDAPFGLPLRPTPFHAEITMALSTGGEEIVLDSAIEHRYQGDIFSGEKRGE